MVCKQRCGSYSRHPGAWHSTGCPTPRLHRASKSQQEADTVVITEPREKLKEIRSNQRGNERTTYGPAIANAGVRV